jgi:hypothetical protein
MTGLKRGKAWSAALVVLLLTLALLALPGFIASRFSGMGSVSSFMPF